MSKLSFVLDDPDTTWLSGEAIVLSATLTNGGEATLRAPSPDGGGFLTVTLTGPDGVAQSYHDGQAAQRRRPDSPPLAPLRMEADLPPGESLTYPVNLDTFMQQPPGLGAYRVEVAIADEDISVSTPKGAITVAPLAPLDVVSLTLPDDRTIVQAMLHGGPDGAAVLLRTSAYQHPGDQGFVRAMTGLPADARIAFCLPVFASLPVMWTAALSEGALSLSNGYVTRQTQIAATSALHPVGWSATQTEAEVLALEQGPDGVTALIATASALTEEVALTRTPLALTEIPKVWRARRRPDSQTYTILYGVGNGLWRVDLTPETATPPRRLFEERGPLAALGFYPVEQASPQAIANIPPGNANYTSGAPAPVVDAVFGPFELRERIRHAFKRYDVDEDARLHSRTFVAPPSEGGHVWAIPLTTGPDMAAALVVGDGLYLLGAEGPATEIARGFTGAAQITLNWFGDAFVASWVDAEGALRFGATQ